MLVFVELVSPEEAFVVVGHMVTFAIDAFEGVRVW